MSLSGYDMHLETDTKVLAISLMHLACFIQKHPLKGRPIEQFPSVLGIGSYVWRLLYVKIVDGGLHSFLFSLFYFIFLFFYFLFSIFRTTRVRDYQSRCHISHKLMA